jgi:hypothetical protein
MLPSGSAGILQVAMPSPGTKLTLRISQWASLDQSGSDTSLRAVTISDQKIAPFIDQSHSQVGAFLLQKSGA